MFSIEDEGYSPSVTDSSKSIKSTSKKANAIKKKITKRKPKNKAIIESETESSDSDDSTNRMGHVDVNEQSMNVDDQKVMDSIVDDMDLVNSYNAAEIKGIEDYAVDLISNQLHHPVISLFRDFSKLEMYSLLDKTKTDKLKALGKLGQSLTLLGLIDYLAVSSGNPLYVDQNSKFCAKLVDRIMNKLSPILVTWSASENSIHKERCTKILKYLHDLIPLFKKSAFDEKFLQTLKFLEDKIQRYEAKYERLKRIMSITTGGKYSKNMDTEDGGTDNTNCFESPKIKTVAIKPDEKHAISNAKYLLKASTAIEEDNDSKKSNPKVIISPRKKPRLDMDNIENQQGSRKTEKGALEKPKLNAFDVLMAKSVQLANARKKIKIAETAGTRKTACRK